MEPVIDLVLSGQEYLALGDKKIQCLPLIDTSLQKLADAGWKMEIVAYRVVHPLAAIKKGKDIEAYGFSPCHLRGRITFYRPSISSHRMSFRFWEPWTAIQGDPPARATFWLKVLHERSEVLHPKFNCDFRKMSLEGKTQFVESLKELETPESYSEATYPPTKLNAGEHMERVDVNDPYKGYKIVKGEIKGLKVLSSIEATIAEPTLDQLLNRFSEVEILEAINARRYLTLDTTPKKSDTQLVVEENLDEVLVTNVVPFPNKDLEAQIENLLAA